MDFKKITKDRWVSFILAFFIGLWSFLALSFPLTQMNVTNLLTYKECGFELFDFNSIFWPDDGKWLCTIVGLVMLVQLALSVALIVFAILSLFDKEYSDTSKFLMIYCYIFIFIYMVLGIIFSISYKNSDHWLDAANEYLGDFNGGTKEVISIFTLSYIPFIIATLALFAYWLYKKLSVKQKELPQQGSIENLNQSQINKQKVEQSSRGSEMQVEQSSSGPEKQVEQSQNVIELLKSYKELLDSGVITQQEFDEIKKKILKL